jgi:hypothetical protein
MKYVSPLRGYGWQANLALSCEAAKKDVVIVTRNGRPGAAIQAIDDDDRASPSPWSARPAGSLSCLTTTSPRRWKFFKHEGVQFVERSTHGPQYH